MEDYKEELSLGRKVTYWIIGIALLLSVIGFMANRATEATHLKDATRTYEEFQEIYNTCTKINQDLCNMKELPETDVMFEQFSKAQRVNTLRTQLNRWVEDYNAKSKMWGKSVWKSNELPYQLSNQNFNCNTQN